MKERPILFSGAMVRALLDGTKTQTRRVLKPAPQMVTHNTITTWDGTPAALQHQLDRMGKGCTYGQPGDKLWVREAWGLHAYGDDTDWLKGGCSAMDLDDHVIAYRADWGPLQDSCHWRPSIHMPRAASRIALEITSVRVERLQDISESDAVAEGIEQMPCAVPDTRLWRNYDPGNGWTPSLAIPQNSFRSLWESINGHDSWDENPWVWVVEFPPPTTA